MLDFSIEDNKQRVKEVQKELNGSLKTPKNSQLEMYANYILYGRDENGLNAVDTGDVEIETKYKSYSKRQIDSIEEMMENPSFSEQNFQPIHRSIYKNPKPELDPSLPQLQELRAAISGYEDLQNRILLTEPDSSARKTHLWKLNHLIITMRKEQYIVQDLVKGAFRPILSPKSSSENFDLGTDVRPMGLKIGNLKRFTDPRNDTSLMKLPFPDPTPCTIDLENPTHIYTIYELWDQLAQNAYQNPYSNTKYLLETVEWYEKNTKLDESRRDIIRLKKLKVQNKEIRDYLNSKYGTSYNENYISTIYTKEICKKIADEVTYEFEKWMNRDNKKMWKKCSCCGRYKFLTEKEFSKRKNSVDGFSSKCKECAKKKKQEVDKK